MGARVEVRAGGCRHASLVAAGGSYLASSPARLFVGLGAAKAVERIEVTWPWGLRETWTNRVVPVHGVLRIEQGSGQRKN